MIRVTRNMWHRSVLMTVIPQLPQLLNNVSVSACVQCVCTVIFIKSVVCTSMSLIYQHMPKKKQVNSSKKKSYKEQKLELSIWQAKCSCEACKRSCPEFAKAMAHKGAIADAVLDAIELRASFSSQARCSQVCITCSFAGDAQAVHVA